MPETPSGTVSPDVIKRLADLVEANGLSELRYEEGDLRITLRTSAYRPATTVAAVTSLPPSPSPVPELNDMTADAVESDLTDGDAAAENQARIEAPLMGVFYRSAKPEDPPFVEVGDTVEVGQVIGLIEAMKVFSEVEAEVAGIVQAFPAQNGKLVQPGDTLLVLTTA